MLRGGGGLNPAETILPDVPLTVVPATLLDWSGFTGPDPDTWQVWQSLTPVGGFSIWVSVTGTDRSYDPGVTANYWFVLGVDSFPNPVTNPSNTVAT